MNQRIKLLAIESKLIAPEYNGFDHTRLSISQQKFAELIVRECVKICKDNGESYQHHMNLSSDLIKQHFGVEE